jgi:N-acetylmuramoyl-L-alanine amidase/Bacterial SH3 domain
MQTKGKFILCTLEEFEEWLTSTGVSRSITLLQNHHTWSPSYAQFTGENHFSLLQGMEDFHIRDRGFDMIAQNLTTFPDGTVAVCRPLDRIPAGIKGANQDGLCMEHLGNFDSGKDSMSDLHRTAIVRVNALLCRKFAISPTTDSIVYHHWYDLDTARRTDGTGNTKSCPGTAFFGGNSVAAARANFIPLLEELVDSDGHSVTPLRRADITVDSLNVRNGAGQNFSVVKTVQRGITVEIHEEKSGWCRIAPDRQEWVFGKYLLTVS